MLRKYSTTITTNSSGAATSYAGLRVTGKIVGIKYEFGTLAATADFAITGEDSTAPILTLTDVAQANTFWYPQILPHQHNDGSVFTDAAGGAPRVFNERIKVVAAQGGDTLTGTMTFYVEDDTFIQ